MVVLDASNGKDAKTNYEAKHLNKLTVVDLNTDLAEMKISQRRYQKLKILGDVDKARNNK
jgi:hypothetical protein